MVAFQAPSLNKAEVYTFFQNLPYVLPCKYCRASLSDYIASDPIPQAATEYAEWLYRIHNRVNGKLREQKLLEAKDPLWPQIKSQYTTLLKQPCTENTMTGWDFLYSVAYTTPCPSVTTAPMRNAPPHIKTPELRNRWGTMTREERVPYLEAWWNTLAHVLPFKRWRNAWSSLPTRPNTRHGRGDLTRWLFKAEKHVCKELKNSTPHSNYLQVCKELSTFSSNCGKQKIKVKTCRTAKKEARSTLKMRRQTTHKLTGGFL
jgi:hypothetical protein